LLDVSKSGNTKVKIVALAMTLVIVAGLVNMTSPDVEADQKYTIQVVTNPDFPPYEYIVADSYEGIDMDIWKAIAQTLACDVNFNVMDFDSIINAIEAGRFDVGASGFTVTEERKQQINFSSTYATAQQTVLVLKNGPLANVTSWEDLKDKTIAVESGTTDIIWQPMSTGIPTSSRTTHTPTPSRRSCRVTADWPF